MITRRKLLYWLGLAPAASILPVDKFGSANVKFDGFVEELSLPSRAAENIQYGAPVKWTMPDGWSNVRVEVECIGQGGPGIYEGGGGGDVARMVIQQASGESGPIGTGGAGRKLAKGEPDVSE